LSGDPEVVFTFDDGPHEVYSAGILDTLATHRVQAIFFWVGERVDERVDDEGGSGSRRRALVPRAVREGHIVANHTTTHLHLCSVVEPRAAYEIDNSRVLLASLAHMPIGLFRTPYGSRCPRLERMLGERGLRHFHWDIDPQEWRHGNIKFTIAYVTRRLERLHGRAVILMHDTKRATAEALPKILVWIDIENAQRRMLGRRPIRVIPASQVVAERAIAPGLADFLRNTARSLARSAVDAVDALVP
jgi:peptidoglycan/xylan/chitin deacetylase (PgdA/CDA1 family)